MSCSESSSTNIPDMEKKLETMKAISTVIGDNVERIANIASTALQDLRTAQKRNDTLKRQKDSLMDQVTNLSLDFGHIEETLHRLLKQRSELYTKYRQEREVRSFHSKYFDSEIAPNIRVDCLLYLEEVRDDVDLFEDVFGLTPTEAQKICERDDDHAIWALNTHAWIRFCNVPLSDENEARFRHFCGKLRVALLAGEELPSWNFHGQCIELNDRLSSALENYILPGSPSC